MTERMTASELLAAYADGRRDFRGANLYGANLYGANLYRANLDGASLVRANLDGASLYGASLDGASLVRASLDGASLVRASLYRANLDGASLVRANLDGANLYGTNLVNCTGVYQAYGPSLSSRHDSLHAGVFERDGGLVLLFNAGCQHQQTAAELREKVRKTHGMNAHAVQYEAAITFIEACFASDMAEGRFEMKERETQS